MDREEAMELKEWGTLITGNMGTNGRSKYSALYLLLESVQVLWRRLPVLNTGTQLPRVRHHQAGLLCRKQSLDVLKRR